MKKEINLYIVTAVLLVLGVVIMSFRHYQTGIPYLSNDKKSVWVIEAKVEFDPIANKPVQASLNLPTTTPNYQIYFQQSVSAGYGFNIVQEDGLRRGVWSKREASGKQTIYYKIQVVEDGSVDIEPSKPLESTEKIIFNQAQTVASKQIIDRAYAKSADSKSFTKELIKILARLENSSEGSVLLDEQKYIDVLSKLLDIANVPNRVSLALELEDARRNQKLTPIIEIFSGEEWVLFDPKNIDLASKKSYFLWSRGGKSLIDLMGAENANVSFSMVKQNIPAVDLAKAHFSQSGFGFFSIHHLPIEEQSLFKILMLLPIGGLITVFMRLIIGIKTSGTFMPVLIAMAFLQTSLIAGAINFVVLVALGLMIRGYLSALNLLLVARIATIIVIVIFLMGFMALFGYELGLSSQISVAFLPIIIISWTIERMSILWEEEGAKEVFIQGGGSLFVATIAYLAMQNGYVSHICFNFPEINFVVIALIMLLGRYTGYRALELYRFREFK